MNRNDELEGAAEAPAAGGGSSLTLLIALAAGLGLLLGGVPVVLLLARRSGPPPQAPVTAPQVDDGLSEEERLRLRAERGDARAQLALGKGLFQGAWGERDEKEAERWLGAAMASTDAAAASEATQVLEELRRFVRTRRFEREAEAAGEQGAGR